MRIEGWETRLADFIESRRLTPFEWGQNDCALFAADAVEVITGVDFAEPLRGKYTTELGAMRALKKHAPDLTAYADNCLPRTPLPFAGRGDVVMHQGGLGICHGAQSFFVHPDTGLSAIPTLECEFAWKVD